MVRFEPSRSNLELYIQSKVQFHWLHSLPTPCSRLSPSLCREVLSYFPTYRYYPVLSSTHMYLFDVHKAAFLSVGLDFTCSLGSRCVLESPFSVLITGAQPPSPQAYCASLDPCSITTLLPMLESRGHHGAVYYRGFLWVFGGLDRGKSAERWGREGERWETIGEMHFPRVAFTPCSYEGKIYLPEISEVLKPFEMLDIARLEFFLLPFSVESRHMGSVSCLVAEELVLITHTGRLGRWPLGDLDAPMVFSRLIFKESEGLPCNSVLIHSGNWIFVVGGDREMLKVDLRPVK